MLRKVLFLVLALGLCLGVTGVVTAADPGQQGTDQGTTVSIADQGTVIGEALRFEGDSYVVQAVTGPQVRVFVDSTTVIETGVSVGDVIVVETTSEGRAVSIKKQAAQQ
jgi:hypothetical protein